jgi:DNA (cytosine-5)-methyltransferase 1
MLGEGLAKGVPVWRNGNQANAAERAMTEPAPTIHFGHALNRVEWIHDRPATTVNADARISEPGHHDENESGSQQKNAVRVSVTEAAILQGFPPDFPWRGSKTAQFRQVGNAVPPPLAKAILASLLDTISEEKAA